MGIFKEGAKSTHVLDAAKMFCPNCDGVEIMLSTLMDDPIDITTDTAFAALYIKNAGSGWMGLVGLCAQCGHEWVPLWYTFDVGATDGDDITMTEFDTDRETGTGANTATDLLIGYYMIYLGSDANCLLEYMTITSNTATDPAVFTVQTHHGSSNGIYMITNVLPLGLDVATAHGE